MYRYGIDYLDYTKSNIWLTDILCALRVLNQVIKGT